MQEFTVIGFWEDTGQRFADFIRAESADQAEGLVADKQGPETSAPIVVAVIKGYHKPKETAVHIIGTTRGIPYTLSEVRKVVETQRMDPYHKELMSWLCDEIDKNNANP